MGISRQFSLPSLVELGSARDQATNSADLTAFEKHIKARSLFYFRYSLDTISHAIDSI